MLNCPRCHQPVDAQAVTCPYCRTALKAYGHPGIPLHRAGGEESLCQSCTYHADDTCTFPQRPHARECTLYQNIAQSQLEVDQRRQYGVSWVSAFKRRQALLILLGLLAVSFFFTLRSSPQIREPKPQTTHHSLLPTQNTTRYQVNVTVAVTSVVPV